MGERQFRRKHPNNVQILENRYNTNNIVCINGAVKANFADPLMPFPQRVQTIVLYQVEARNNLYLLFTLPHRGPQALYSGSVQKLSQYAHSQSPPELTVIQRESFASAGRGYKFNVSALICIVCSNERCYKIVLSIARPVATPTLLSSKWIPNSLLSRVKFCVYAQ